MIFVHSLSVCFIFTVYCSYVLYDHPYNPQFDLNFHRIQQFSQATEVSHHYLAGESSKKLGAYILKILITAHALINAFSLSCIQKQHCVFYGVESWSGVLEWSIGVESSQILEWQKWLVLSELTAKQHWGFDLVTLFGCFHISCNILMNRAKENLPLQNLTLLHSNTPLQNRIHSASKQCLLFREFCEKTMPQLKVQ